MSERTYYTRQIDCKLCNVFSNKQPSFLDSIGKPGTKQTDKPGGHGTAKPGVQRTGKLSGQRTGKPSGQWTSKPAGKPTGKRPFKPHNAEKGKKFVKSEGNGAPKKFLKKPTDGKFSKKRKFTPGEGNEEGRTYFCSQTSQSNNVTVYLSYIVSFNHLSVYMLVCLPFCLRLNTAV